MGQLSLSKLKTNPSLADRRNRFDQLQIVGVLLVFTLMVGPAAAALAFTGRLYAAMALSAALALVEAWGGLTLAFYSDWPVSFWITALSGLVYFASLVNWRALGRGAAGAATRA